MDGDYNSESNINEAQEDEVELTGCSAKPCCNPSHPLHRFLALLFMCLLGFGKFYYNMFSLNPLSKLRTKSDSNSVLPGADSI